MIRVHVKVHPDRWYYHADRLGLLVWQDMVCTRRFEPKITAESAAQWELEQRRMIDYLRNHPSVIQWIVFNEGWGQYDTERLTTWTMKYDPTRVVANASGWNDVPGAGHVRDVHDYSIIPTIPLPEREGDRAIVIGEFGGFNVYLKGHLWYPDKIEPEQRDWVREAGRERYADGQSWLTSYRRWIQSWKPLIGEHGLSAGVYTQIADVEHEPNGWLTYDREISKIPVETLRALHAQLYAEQEKLRVMMPNGAGQWRYTTSAPAAGWEQPGFDDSLWRSGAAPFGDAVARTPRVATLTAVKEIWMRRAFHIQRAPKAYAVRAYGRGDAEVWINGKLARALNHRGPRDNDVGVTIQPVWPEAGADLRAGENVIAVHAFVANAPIFVDIGIVEMVDSRR